MDIRSGTLDAIGNTPLIRFAAHPKKPAATFSARPSS